MRIIIYLLLALHFTTTIAAAQPEQVARHSVIFSGKANGSQTTAVESDGRIVIDYTYRNNGRGPDLREEIVLAADGTQRSYKATGKTTFGAPVNEQFTRDGSRSSWRSLAGQGEMVDQKSSVYVPQLILSDCSPESLAILARAALRTPSQSLPAMPGGSLRVQKLDETSISSGDEPLDVSLFAVHGLTTHPEFIWLTSDSSMKFFAYIDPGDVQIIAAENEAHGETLEKLQIEAENKLIEAIAKRVTHRLPEPIVFRNVRVFDSSSGALSEPSDVYVSRGRVAAIYPPGSPARDVGTSVECEGKTLLPGLFDTHGHEGPWSGLLQIAGGVTTSRDMANDNATLAKLMERIEAGTAVGPRIVPCGFIEGQSPFSARTGIVVANLQEAKDAVDWYAQRGYRQIKIYNSFNPQWVAPTAEYAHARGMRVSGHVPAFMKAEEAVAAGYDEIQHINQVLLNFVVRPEDDTRTLARFTRIASNVHELDLESPAVRRFIKLLKDEKTTIDTTVAIFESMFTQMQGEMNPSYRDVEDHVPVALRREWLLNSMDLNPGNVETWRASYAKILEFIALMHREGIPLLAGTDDIAGFTLHRELELYVKAGISPPDALRIATHNGAKYTGTLDSVGSVQPGKYADLLLIDGDPTKDISHIRRAVMVMKEGTVYYPSEIYEACAIAPFHDPPEVTIENSN
jgi:dihydroorotase-like cyclic amidohydrolase